MTITGSVVGSVTCLRVHCTCCILCSVCSVQWAVMAWAFSDCIAHCSAVEPGFTLCSETWCFTEFSTSFLLFNRFFKHSGCTALYSFLAVQRVQCGACYLYSISTAQFAIHILIPPPASSTPPAQKMCLFLSKLQLLQCSVQHWLAVLFCLLCGNQTKERSGHLALWKTLCDITLSHWVG